jgi:DNA-binding NarL/FixJ family response regulator
MAPSSPPQSRGKIRILIADDHRILREGLASVIKLAADMEIVGEASEGPEALDLARALRPEVIIMDVNMPGVSGIETTKILKSELPAISVIGLSMHVDPEIASTMLEAGALAYLSKESGSENLLTAIRRCRFRRPAPTKVAANFK